MFEKFSKSSFLIGPGPIRRTIPYLKSGKLIFKDRVKIMEVHLNRYLQHSVDKLRPSPVDAHLGLKEFYFWHVPHIQYKNPNVQIVRFVGMMPHPFIRCWLDDGNDVLFECYSKSKDEILQQLIKVLGKTKEQLAFESAQNREQLNENNPAIFGFGRKRFCMCEIPGQVPCSGTCDLPKGMIGKYKSFMKEELEAWENDLDAEYPKQELKAKKHQWYPTPLKPIVEEVKGLDKMEIGKTQQRSIPPDPRYLEFLKNQNEDFT